MDQATERQFSGFFERLRSAFPQLSMETYSNPPAVDLGVHVPVQPGIELDVCAFVQGDELLLGVGDFDFVCSWFPAGDAAVTDRYHDAVEGFLSGQYRILQYRRRGRAVKADLQRSDGSRWLAIARFRSGLLPSSWGASRRVIRNGSIDRAPGVGA